MVFEEHRHSDINITTTYVHMLTLYHKILYQSCYYVLYNSVCYINKDIIEKVGDMDCKVSAIYTTYLTVHRCDEKPCHHLYHNYCCNRILVASQFIRYKVQIHCTIARK